MHRCRAGITETLNFDAAPGGGIRLNAP